MDPDDWSRQEEIAWTREIAARLTLDRRSPGEALWQQIARQLRNMIADGTIPVGMPIPGKNPIRGVLHCSGDTVDRATAQLKREGLVMRERGRGLVVVLKPR